MNSQMWFRSVLGSIAPPEPPTVEQATACLGYALKKWSVHRRCLIVPSSGIRVCSAKSFHKTVTTGAVVPKNSRKARSSSAADPMLRPLLFWMSLPMRTKSSGVGSALRFRLLLLSSSMMMWRGGRGDKERSESRGCNWKMEHVSHARAPNKGVWCVTHMAQPCSFPSSKVQGGRGMRQIEDVYGGNTC